MSNKQEIRPATAPVGMQPVKPQPRFKVINRQQLIMRAVDVEELVAADHEVRAIWELVGKMDVSRFSEGAGAVEGVAGRPRWDPQLMISLWLYASKSGISAAREIERLCEYHPAYQWLTGMMTINHHSLSDFRVQHGEALDELFAAILGVLSAEGLITLERVMQDGTKIRAHASDNTFRREGRVQAHLELAREQVRQMGDPRSAAEVGPRVAQARRRAAREKQERLESALTELEKIRATKTGAEDKKEARVSMTDPEARIMKQSDGGYRPSYNVQLSTDAAHGIIVDVGVSQAAVDYGELVPAVERVEKNLGQLPEQVVVDGGFISRENIMACERKQVDLIGPVTDCTEQRQGQFKKRGIAAAFQPEAFSYDAAVDGYICPANIKLPYESKAKLVGCIHYRYRARASDCQACAFKSQCCPRNASKGRSLVRVVDDPVVADFKTKMETLEAKHIYKKRGEVAEFANAWIKDKNGLRQFCLRGLVKVGIEALWVCLTYNVQQWIRLCWRPRLVLAST